MRNINYISRKAICCTCAAIFLWTLGVTISFGETEAKAPGNIVPKWDFDSMLEEMLEVSARASKDVSDRLAEEQYEKRGAEIAPWMKDTALPSPDNAALLYYQAFLNRPQLDVKMIPLMNKVLHGAEPDKTIRIYLGHCRKTIQLTELASQIPQCTWGIRHPGGHELSITTISGPLRDLAEIFALDARTLAADGHCRAALARCLTIRRLARHLGDDTVLLYLISRNIDNMAQITMQHVLGAIPPDADMLMWLRGQLFAVQGTPPSFAKALQTDCELIFQDMLRKPDILKEIRDYLAENAESEDTKEKKQNLKDEELLSRARETYTRFLDSVFQIMDSDMSYEQKCAEIRTLTNKLKDDYGIDPAIRYLIFRDGAGQIVERYSFLVRSIAGLNALKAAIEVYLVKAKTGQLPEKLPDYLPKDPYSSQDFEYETTEEGFVLRCRVKDIRRGKVQQYEFKIQK